jgi:hypothetical protein
MSDTTIKLGEKEFKISPLTIRQSRDMRIGSAELKRLPGGEGWASSYDVNIELIAIAIREDHPEVTKQQLWELRFTEKELGAAGDAILIHAGFASSDPTIAELRAKVTSLKKDVDFLEKSKTELADLERTLAVREEKAKVTGEG